MPGGSPFKRVDDIYKSGAQFNDDGYVQFIVNKEVSKNPLLIGLVNEVQQYSLANHLHFKVLNTFAPLTKRPGFKAFPWIWKGGKKVDQDVEVVAKYYNESTTNAKEYLEILNMSDDGKEHLEWLRSVYGLKNVKKKK
ncbi:MAG: hypothetical protein VW683_01380 [Betaproteobacteria bacterium]|jgi:hypothetical protein